MMERGVEAETTRCKEYSNEGEERFKMRQMKSVSAIFVLLLVGFAFTISPAYGQLKLNYSTFFPASHSVTILSVEWGKEIEKRTNGRIKVTVFPGEILTPADKCYDGVVQGISDVGLSAFSRTLGRFPLMEIVDLPLGYKSATVATRLVNDFYRKFKPKELGDVQVMYLMGHGPGLLNTKKPVKKLEDLKRMKIRARGTVAKIVSALGGTPVGIPMSETYDALSMGVAEGVMCPAESLKGWKLGEVTEFMTESYPIGYTTGFFVVMNKEKWNAISPEDQKIIKQINEEWIVKHEADWDRIDKEGREFAEKLGHKFIPLSKAEGARWVKAVQPLFDAYVKEKSEKGLPAAEALKYCKDRLNELQGTDKGKGK
jgi:TRAP-type C4-dicarboxylate transport system substrate-binding protein